jgi:hypothetical protein
MRFIGERNYLSTPKLGSAVPSVAWELDSGQSPLDQGDSLQLMAALPADSVDCIWTDPRVQPVQRRNRLRRRSDGESQQRGVGLEPGR